MKKYIKAAYEILVSDPDPFNIVYDDCQVDEVEFWQRATQSDLVEMHNADLADNAYYNNHPDEKMAAVEDGWRPAPKDFNAWLNRAIHDGYVRMAQHA